MSEQQATAAPKVEVTLNEKNMPVWRTEDGKVIRELKREVFFNEHVTKENKQEAEREFFDYMHNFKLVKAAEMQEKADKLNTQAQEYAVKRDNVGKELSEVEKTNQDIARLMKQLEAKKAKLAALA